MTSDPLAQLHGRPGFMIRRAHQIAVAVFVEETADLGITTTQFGILYLLRHHASIDQITVARLLGLDRSTTSMVLKTLESAGLVARVVEATDKRRRSLELTPAGADMLGRLEAPAARAIERLLSPLAADERPLFLSLLHKLTAAFNATSRVPLMTTALGRPATPGQRPAASRTKAELGGD